MSARCGCGGRGLPCGCCEGVGSRAERAAVRNGPGLDAIEYRAGTHGSFLDAMLARLTSHELSDRGDPPPRPLAALTSRRRDDPAIALLDAWATVADVLTFYSERIANEGYLRTADERRSILELARLVGYRLRPGVSSSTYVAYTVDPGTVTTIPAGARSVTVPGPGELPQSFETSDDLEARGDWSELPVRRHRPALRDEAAIAGSIGLVGTATNLKAGDRLLLARDDGDTLARVVTAVTTVPDEDRTAVELEPLAVGDDPTLAGEGGAEIAVEAAAADGHRKGRNPQLALIEALRMPPSVPPARAADLLRSRGDVLGELSGAIPHLITAVDRRLEGVLGRARATYRRRAYEPPVAVAPRAVAAPFGAAAPPPRNSDGQPTGQDWTIFGKTESPDPIPIPTLVGAAPPGARGAAGELPTWQSLLPLDAVYEGVLPGTEVVVERPGSEPLVTTVERVHDVGFAAYDMSGRVTVLQLADEWLDDDAEFAQLRATTVRFRGERLELAPERLEDDVEGSRIELAGLYPDLPAGRWVVVSGERTDVPGATGVTGAELAMVAGTEESADPARTGDLLHTTLVLSTRLAYSYRRDTCRVQANVVKVTHGESRLEAPAAGDASQPLQEFPLSQFPLTHLPAATALGAASTLELRVDDVLWHEEESLLDLGPGERGYFTTTGEDDRTAAHTGDGRDHGARPTTGSDNVRLRYRTGTGRAGNVRAGQISQLTTKPLGVTAVVNPLPATGGADRDGRDSARRGVPTSTFALERLVSVLDYEEFTRARAGFGKASAALLSDGRQRFVHLTVAGADDAPIAPTSDLMVALRRALAACGDPHLRVDVAVRELLLIALDAGVRVAPDREWATVEPRVRAALAEAFGFERRELGEGVHLSRVVSAIQSVPGVEHVDVDGLATIGEADLTEDPDGLADLLAPPPAEHLAVRLATVERKPGGWPAADDGPRRAYRVVPAQLAVISPTAPDTVLLREIR
ncbi:MAG TPA: putative baseplate assembly protein [Thermoleophilaceae bacterium]